MRILMFTKLSKVCDHRVLDSKVPGEGARK